MFGRSVREKTQVSLTVAAVGSVAAAGVPSVGDEMPDGTIFAGISPETNKPMYAMTTDEPAMPWDKAMRIAQERGTCGHSDWHIATQKELCVLFNNRADIGGFNTSGDLFKGWYWASSETSESVAGVLRFSDGKPSIRTKDMSFPVRLIRS
ncbi:MAG: DUF1566 domain-containing protein [Proteobacteria bacterium]|nr:DUF1566 domain-containing protein [Pseudomonadota bacterium]